MKIRTRLCGLLLALLMPCALAAHPWNEMKRVMKSIQTPVIAKRTLNITDFHTPGDSLYTKAINKAIEECSARGGGRVVVPDGDFLTGPIRMRSGVELHLSDHTRLRFITDYRQFPIVLTRIEGIDCWNVSPLIYAYGEHDIAVTGKGTLDGQATTDNWYSKDFVERRDPNGKKASEKYELNLALERQTPVDQRRFTGPRCFRPQFINFYKCSRILLEDFEVNRSPFWLIHPLLSDNITVRGLRLISHGRNNDGCDPESCRNVLIENCTFDTGDDCIAIKSGKDADGRRWNLPSENIIVRKCRMKDGHAGMAIGSEITGGCRKVWMEDCHMDSPELGRMLRIKSNPVRGGEVSDIYVRDVEVGEVSLAIVGIELNYWHTHEGPYAPSFHDIYIEGVTSGKSRYVLHVDGPEGKGWAHAINFSKCDFSGVTAPEVNKAAAADNVAFDNVTVNGDGFAGTRKESSQSPS